MVLISLAIYSSFTSKNSKFAAFSVKENFKSLIKVKKDSSISVMRGFNSLILFSTVFSHIILFAYFAPSKDSKDTLPFRNSHVKTFSIKIVNGNSIFHAMSGMLTTISCIRLIEK